MRTLLDKSRKYHAQKHGKGLRKVMTEKKVMFWRSRCRCCVVALFTWETRVREARRSGQQSAKILKLVKRDWVRHQQGNKTVSNWSKNWKRLFETRCVDAPAVFQDLGSGCAKLHWPLRFT
jgi:hypothetical protein